MATLVTVTATSQADPSKVSSATLTVTPSPAVLTVSPTGLSFSGQLGAAPVSPSSVSITNTGTGVLAFTGLSDQPWLLLSSASGNTPSTLVISPSITTLKAGSYTGHVTLTGGGATKVVTVALTVAAAAVQHTVSLSWKGSTAANIAGYNMYRSTISGGYYSLLANAIIGVAYIDKTVLAATTYYYEVTVVDSKGLESARSNQISAVIP